MKMVTRKCASTENSKAQKMYSDKESTPKEKWTMYSEYKWGRKETVCDWIRWHVLYIYMKIKGAARTRKHMTSNTNTQGTAQGDTVLTVKGNTLPVFE